MDLTGLKYIHFIGIGGIGMSALARYFNHMGLQISGYDKTRTPLTDQLQKEGISIYYQEDEDLIPEYIRSNPASKDVLIVYTPAIPNDFAEIRFFRNRNVPLYKRAEILGIISTSLKTIAVAGTHGKTTTTSLLAVIMLEAKLDFVAFVGGINGNFDSNLLINGNPEFMLTEADEYDRSFLHLSPSKAILTSIDADHLDIYGNQDAMIESFTAFSKSVRDDLWISEKIGSKLKNVSYKRYGLTAKADAYPENIRTNDSTFTFDYRDNHHRIENIPLTIPGYHNLENCTAAIAMALSLGIGSNCIKDALKNYRGVKRRFEYHINSPDLIYIDDYAHHPSEIDAVVSSIRKMYPGKRITGVFQPHLFSRTRDFGLEFAQSLEKLDELLLLEIYPAREKPLPGIDSQWLLDKVHLTEKERCSKENLIQKLAEKKPEIILTIGAGDIDQLVIPIKNHFQLTKP